MKRNRLRTVVVLALTIFLLNAPRISAPTEKVRAYGRVEKFQMMAQKNSALLQLKEEFGLELY